MSTPYQTVKYSELASQLESLLLNRKSFVVIENPTIADTVTLIENAIERLHMSCRVYTAYRSVVAAASWIVPVVGAAYTAAIIGHRIGTNDPDYEIARYLWSKQVEVTYKK